MLEGKLFLKRKGGIMVQHRNLLSLFITLNIDVELALAKPTGSVGERWWIRMGPKHEGFHNNVVKQVKALEFMPPRNGSLATYKRRLKHAINEENSKNDDSNDSDSDKSEEGETNDDDDNDDVNDAIQASQANKQSMYPLLTKLASDVNTLTDAALKILMGELVHLQRSRTAKSAAKSTNNESATDNEAPQCKSVGRIVPKLLLSIVNRNPI